MFYREGKSQKLKRQEAVERNQDKKAIAAENWYRPHNFARQGYSPASSRRSVTLAVEHAAASERYDKTWIAEKLNTISAVWQQ